MHDIIIIGGGPAGLTAAIYARRANKTVLVIEKDAFGGQMTHSPKIENYPGFSEISGLELADKMFEQAMKLGADIEVDSVISLKDQGGYVSVLGENGSYSAKTAIIASGAKHRKLGVYGEEEHEGNGISFCAVCDGAFYSGKEVSVIGGGNSALQEALMLSEVCTRVTVIQNLPYLTGEDRLQKSVEAKNNISVITDARVLGFPGESFNGVDIEAHGERAHIDCDGCFIAIGLVPDNGFARDCVDIDGYGYVVADENCTTPSPCIFTAGDCRTKRIRQISTAIADGATAALAAIRFLEK